MGDVAEPAVDEAFEAATVAPMDQSFNYQDSIDAPSPFAPRPGLEHELSPEAFESLVAEQAAAEAAFAADAAPPAKAEESPEVAEEPAAEWEEVAAVEETPAVDSPIPDVEGAEPIVVSGFDPFEEPDAADAAAIAGSEAAAIEVEEQGDATHPAGVEAMDDVVIDADEEFEIEFEMDNEPGDATEPSGEVPPPASLYEEAEAAAAEAAIEPAPPRQVDVAAQDNQLHLRLQGTGAIVESGQVRELDIEVPVPGAWVGHKRVTLQLRLTLTPDSEDENDGSGGTA
jgi:hypothetical protein